MKICWFDEKRLGVVAGDKVYDVTAALRVLPTARYPAAPGDLFIAHLPAVVKEIEQLLPQATTKAVADVCLLSPVQNPSKIIGTPANYLKHAEEADAHPEVFTTRYVGSIEEQGLFLKATSSLVGCGEGVRVRFPDRRTDHEVELGVVIGREANNISEQEALDYVAGYAIALDMVVRGSEDRSFRKSVQTYAVLGPWLVTADEIKDPQNLDFRISVNGSVRQSSNTKLMIMNLSKQISWASSFYTLYPGDILMSGTCEGVGQVRPGDIMECEIESIGSMTVSVS